MQKFLNLIIALFLLLSTNKVKSQIKSSSLSYILKELGDNDARPPIVIIPGMMSTRLIAWKEMRCSRGSPISINDVVWLNIQKIVETVTFDHYCWLECLRLGRNGSDPKSCKIRPDEGISAISELSPGNLYTPPSTTIFGPLIKYLVRLTTKYLSMIATNSYLSPSIMDTTLEAY